MGEELQRPDLYVVARILEALRRNGEALRRTPLQIASGVNYTQFERYFELLRERKLVSTRLGEDGAELVELTSRGYDALLFVARAIRDFLGDDFGHSGSGRDSASGGPHR